MDEGRRLGEIRLLVLLDKSKLRRCWLEKIGGLDKYRLPRISRFRAGRRQLASRERGGICRYVYLE